MTDPTTRPTRPRLTVIGTGYLGATHAICMAVLGYEVLGVDIDAAKIEALASGRVPFFEPGLPEMLAQGPGLRPAAVHHRPRRGGRVRRRPLHLRRHAPAARLDRGRPALRRGRGARPGAAPAPPRPWWSASPPCRSGTAHRLTRLVQDQAPAGTTSSWPGTRSSCARASPSRTRCSPDRLVFGVASPWALAQLRADVRAGARGGRPGGHDRPADRRAGEGRRQLVPRHQDLLHQRDGRGVRGDRRRRAAAGQGPGLRRPHRRPVPASRGWASAAAACPRTSGPSCTAPRSSASASRSPSCARSTRSTAGVARGPSTSSARRPAATWPASASAPSAPPSSPTPTTSATRPPSTSPDAAGGGRRRAGLRPAGDGERPARLPGPALRRRRDGGGRRAPTSWCCSPSGTSSARSTPTSSAPWWPAGSSWTAGTPSTPTAWRAAGWVYRALGRAS